MKQPVGFTNKEYLDHVPNTTICTLVYLTCWHHKALLRKEKIQILSI